MGLEIERSVTLTILLKTNETSPPPHPYIHYKQNHNLERGTLWETSYYFH